MSRLRVLHVVPYYGDAWAYGGIPRTVPALARALAARGHAVVVATTDARDARRRGAPGRSMHEGVVVERFRNVSNALAYRVQGFLPLALAPWLSRHAGEFDVAHLHACRNAPGLLAARHLARAGVPWVLTPHGTAPIIERRRLAKRLFDLVAGPRVVRDAGAVIAATEAERDDLGRIDVDRARIVVIPPAIELEEFDAPPAGDRFRAALGVGDAPLVVFLGQLTPRKRLDVLIEAFARLSDDRCGRAHLAIVGNDQGAGRAAAALATRLGVAARTHFRGLTAGRARLEALAAADVVAYASEAEIFGLVALEAILAGTPVVVADDSGCGQVVAAVGGGHVVRVGDAGALAAALRAILADRHGWRAAARSATVAVRARYGGAAVAARTEGLYESVVAGRVAMERPA